MPDLHWWFGPINAVGATDQLVRFLAADELAHLADISSDKRRREYIAGHALIRLVLAPLLNTNPAAIPIAYEPAGKPYIAGQDDWHFSISHSAEHLLITWGGQRHGVDLQAHDERTSIDQLAQRWFHADEFQQFCEATDTNQRLLFFDGWARKEAVVKGLGTGIAGGLDAFAIDLATREPHPVTWVGEAQMANAICTPLPVADRFSAALVTTAPVNLRQLAFLPSLA